MKKVQLVMVVSCVIGMWVFISGCGKQQEATPPTGQGQKAADTAVSDMQKTVGAVADKAKEAAQKTTAEVQKQASEVAAAAQTQAQTIIDQAKKLVDQGKHTEAMSLLQQKLSGLKLTPEQQKLVDGLKEQIQKAISSAAKDTTKTAQDLKKTLGQ